MEVSEDATHGIHLTQFEGDRCLVVLLLLPVGLELPILRGLLADIAK